MSTGITLEDWKRTPTTVEALFAIDLPYRPPKNPVGAFLWRQRIWIETTCGLSLLEPWEKLLVREYLAHDLLPLLAPSGNPQTDLAHPPHAPTMLCTM